MRAWVKAVNAAAAHTKNHKHRNLYRQSCLLFINKEMTQKGRGFEKKSQLGNDSPQCTVQVNANLCGFLL